MLSWVEHEKTFYNLGARLNINRRKATLGYKRLPPLSRRNHKNKYVFVRLVYESLLKVLEALNQFVTCVHFRLRFGFLYLPQTV